MSELPLPLLLALNGALVILLACMLASAAAYLVQKLIEARSAREAYVECKAALSMVSFLAGLEIRTGSIWWTQLLRHNGHDVTPTTRDAVTALLVFGSIPMAWGAICWMRVVLPIDCGPWTWVAIAVAATALGVGFAL